MAPLTRAASNKATVLEDCVEIVCHTCPPPSKCFAFGLHSDQYQLPVLFKMHGGPDMEKANEKVTKCVLDEVRNTMQRLDAPKCKKFVPQLPKKAPMRLRTLMFYVRRQNDFFSVLKAKEIQAQARASRMMARERLVVTRGKSPKARSRSAKRARKHSPAAPLCASKSAPKRKRNGSKVPKTTPAAPETPAVSKTPAAPRARSILARRPKVVKPPCVERLRTLRSASRMSVPVPEAAPPQVQIPVAPVEVVHEPALAPEAEPAGPAEEPIPDSEVVEEEILVNGADEVSEMEVGAEPLGSAEDLPAEKPSAEDLAPEADDLFSSDHEAEVEAMETSIQDSEIDIAPDAVTAGDAVEPTPASEKVAEEETAEGNSSSESEMDIVAEPPGHAENLLVEEDPASDQEAEVEEIGASSIHEESEIAPIPVPEKVAEEEMESTTTLECDMGEAEELLASNSEAAVRDTSAEVLIAEIPAPDGAESEEIPLDLDSVVSAAAFPGLELPAHKVDLPSNMDAADNLKEVELLHTATEVSKIDALKDNSSAESEAEVTAEEDPAQASVAMEEAEFVGPALDEDSALICLPATLGELTEDELLADLSTDELIPDISKDEEVELPTEVSKTDLAPLLEEHPSAESEVTAEDPAPVVEATDEAESLDRDLVPVACTLLVLTEDELLADLSSDEAVSIADMSKEEEDQMLKLSAEAGETDQEAVPLDSQEEMEIYPVESDNLGLQAQVKSAEASAVGPLSTAGMQDSEVQSLVLDAGSSAAPSSQMSLEPSPEVQDKPAAESQKVESQLNMAQVEPAPVQPEAQESIPESPAQVPQPVQKARHCIIMAESPVRTELTVDAIKALLNPVPKSILLKEDNQPRNQLKEAPSKGEATETPAAPVQSVAQECIPDSLQVSQPAVAPVQKAPHCIIMSESPVRTELTVDAIKAVLNPVPKNSLQKVDNQLRNKLIKAPFKGEAKRAPATAQLKRPISSPRKEQVPAKKIVLNRPKDKEDTLRNRPVQATCSSANKSAAPAPGPVVIPPKETPLKNNGGGAPSAAASLQRSAAPTAGSHQTSSPGQDKMPAAAAASGELKPLLPNYGSPRPLMAPSPNSYQGSNYNTPHPWMQRPPNGWYSGGHGNYGGPYPHHQQRFPHNQQGGWGMMPPQRMHYGGAPFHQQNSPPGSMHISPRHRLQVQVTAQPGSPQPLLPPAGSPRPLLHLNMMPDPTRYSQQAPASSNRANRKQIVFDLHD